MFCRQNLEQVSNLKPTCKKLQCNSNKHVSTTRSYFLFSSGMNWATLESRKNCSVCVLAATVMRYRFGWHTNQYCIWCLIQMRGKLWLTGVRLYSPHVTSQLSSYNVICTKSKGLHSVFNQFPLKSVSWLRGRKATDFALDQQRNPTHPVVTQLLTEQKTVSTLLGQVRNDRATASYSSSTSAHLWWRVRKPHPYKWHLCKVSLWQMLHDQSVTLGILTAQRKCI